MGSSTSTNSATNVDFSLFDELNISTSGGTVTEDPTFDEKNWILNEAYVGIPVPKVTANASVDLSPVSLLFCLLS